MVLGEALRSVLLEINYAINPSERHMALIFQLRTVELSHAHHGLPPPGPMDPNRSESKDFATSTVCL